MLDLDLSVSYIICTKLYEVMKVNLTTYTLRYYDREGLLSNVGRDKSGNRIFSKDDMEILSLICCLKNTGMPIKEIKQFIDWQEEFHLSQNPCEPSPFMPLTLFKIDAHL